jgi:dipeptidyl aminopeptidase/acylaminoacyl peptidase
MVAETDGYIDGFALSKDRLFVIAMLGQQLEELYEVKDGKYELLSGWNTEVFADTYVAKPEKVIVKKAVDIEGWVLKPINFDPSKKYPGILDIHGGPKSAYGEIYYHEMQLWASRGYFVFYCNPRGSDGRGNAFADLRHQFGGIDYQDIMAFVRKVLESYPAIDEKRVGVTGGSYGGYMTNWIVGQTDFFKCAAAQRSISNWITEVGVSDYGIDFPIEQEFGDVRECAPELWGMSPLKFVNRAKTPMLFIHSTEDYRCPVPEALQMYTALTCNGVETRMVLFKGENHELSRGGKPKHRIKRQQ